MRTVAGGRNKKTISSTSAVGHFAPHVLAGLSGTSEVENRQYTVFRERALGREAFIAWGSYTKAVEDGS